VRPRGAGGWVAVCDAGLAGQVADGVVVACRLSSALIVLRESPAVVGRSSPALSRVEGVVGRRGQR
jgi:hypothetical protein